MIIKLNFNGYNCESIDSIPKRSKSQDRNESQDGGETDRAPSELTRERKSREPTVTTSDKDVPLYDKDLIRMMAEVNFINGEVSWKIGKFYVCDFFCCFTKFVYLQILIVCDVICISLIYVCKSLISVCVSLNFVCEFLYVNL